MTLLFTVLAVTLLTPADKEAGPKTMPMIVLADQFAHSRQLAAERGDVIVLIYGDRASATANQTLGTQLHVAFHPTAKGLPPAQACRAPVQAPADWPADLAVPEVRVVPIATVGKVPGLVASMIRGQFKQRSPDVPVYLDFEDRMKQHFGLATGVTNLVVVDTKGNVRAAIYGSFTPEKTTQLVRLIEQLRQEARPQN